MTLCPISVFDFGLWATFLRTMNSKGGVSNVNSTKSDDGLIQAQESPLHLQRAFIFSCSCILEIIFWMDILCKLPSVNYSLSWLLPLICFGK